MVRLSPVNDDEYREFVDWSMRNFAAEQIKAGVCDAGNADASAKKAFAVLLPQGLQSPGQFIYVIERVSDAEKLGYMWFGIRDERGETFAALYDFMIFEQYRRHGYGRRALSALEEEARELGMKKIMLHVFAHNQAARALYLKAGYSGDEMMAKEIG